MLKKNLSTAFNFAKDFDAAPIKHKERTSQADTNL